MQNNPDQNGALSAFHELVERDLLSVVFESTTAQIFVVDAETKRFVAANAAARNGVAVSMPQLRQMGPSDIMTGFPLGRIETLLDTVRHRKSKRATFTIGAAGVSAARHEINVVYADQDMPSFVLFIGDVSKTQRKLTQTSDTLHTAIDALSDGFVLYDAHDRLVICNAKYRELYKLSGDLVRPGSRFEDILRAGLKNGQYANAIGREEAWLQERLIAHKAAETEVEQKLTDGRWLRIVERRTGDGGRVGLRVDITTIKQQQQALKRLALTDDLTGMLNRRGLTKRLHDAVDQLGDGHRPAVFQVDLDRFKNVNELRGLEAGDFVLQRVAQIMEYGPLRPLMAARVGGDEFVLVLRTRRSNGALIKLAHKLIGQLSESIFYEGQKLNVGASIGIACYRPDHANPISDMTSGADIALNQVKQNGGNDAIMFHDSMREETERNNRMAEQIRLGLTRQEIFPFFQPQIDTETGDIIGFESLIRWEHPTKGLVPAFQFLEIAQRSGLTEVLDDVVMDRSCFAAKQLLEWGMKKPRVSINMSIEQISDPTIVTRLECHMRTHGVTSEHIRIELLESTLLDKHSSQIVRNVHDLIAAGFPVELDDFGTGHAAIATLRQFAVSCIKIDRSLVQNIDTDTELQVITSAIIGLANRLGIGVLAEGVETSPEQATLQQMGCHRAQGYLHARPMPLAQLNTFLKERNLVP